MIRAVSIQRLWSLALLACSWPLAACQDEPYCFNCDGAQSGAGGDRGATDGSTGGRLSLSSAGEGNDGDGTSDTDCDADLKRDPFNCGKCGRVCKSPRGMIASCSQGICSFDCAAGHWDLDKDVEGCEYTCTQSNDGVEKCDGRDNDCDGQVDEDISKKTLENCGACDTPCSVPGARFSCDTGSCELVACLDGFHDIDKKQSNGCEYRCAVTNDGVEVCDGLDNDCNGEIDEDVDTSSDPMNCGACGTRCIGDYPKAESVCRDGECVMGACEAGYSDKDGDPENGCEYSCQATCFFPFADFECGDDDVCAMGECLPGYWDIDQDPDNGCEYPCAPTNDGVEVCDGLDNDCNGEIDDQVDTSADTSNCGACGTSCAGRFPNAAPSCVDGECVLGECASGYGNQDGDEENGCEYNCESTCFFAFAEAECGDDDVCTMGECLSGYWDIDQDPDNGCEYPCAPTNDGIEICDGLDNDCNELIDDNADTSADTSNCGACGTSCAGRFPNSAPSCLDGECALGECLPGYSNQDGDEENGCEYNCESTCFFAFAQALCDDAGACTMGQCLSGYWDIDQDPDNGCEYPCAPTNDGVEVCDGIDNDCNQLIDDGVDTSSDPLHCGGCGESCVGVYANAEPTCSGGQCVLGTCLDDYEDLDGDPDTGCEFSCEATCSVPFATSSCDDEGSCVMGECLVGYFDIDEDPDNGCEYACTETNGGVEECDGLDNDCDGDVDEDFDLDTSEAHCGGCYVGCAAYFPGATTDCVEGACQPTGCLPGWANIDGTLLNGCEYSCDLTNGGVEICDGIDNDCNGIADDEPAGGFDPPLAEQCEPNDPNAACESRTLCVGGQPVCVEITGPSREVCDGVDNDCDGDIDEHSALDPLPQVGKPCGESQVGECSFGTTVCNGASGVSCEGAVYPEETETCNGKDDDCNGVADDDPEGQGDACTLGGGQGACANGGTQQCMGESGFVCSGATAPATEICDGPVGTTDPVYDNDCNGQVNEGCAYPAASPVRLDTTSSTQTQHSTFQLAATSTGNTYLVVYSDRRTGNGDVYGRVSTNAGSSWGSGDMRLTADDTRVEVEPSPMITPNRAYVVYSRFAQDGDGNNTYRRIRLRRADALYTSWGPSTPVTIDGSPASTVDCYSSRGVIAKAGTSASTDMLAVVWSEIAGTSADPTRNIRLSYSKDGTASWTRAILVNTGDGADKAELPVIASDAAGIVYIAWRDKRTTGAAQVYFTRIDLTQSSPALETGVPLQPAGSADDIVMDAAGSNVYVAWTDLRDDAKAIRVASSNDRGVTWSQVDGVTDGVVVNTDSTFADASKPALDVRGERVVVVWSDTRSGQADIRLNRSDDAGATWLDTCPRVDTGDTLGATNSLLPSVALGWEDHVIVAWQDFRFPRSSILANLSMNAGGVFHADAGGVYRMDTDTLIPGADSQTPLVLASESVNRGSVVWIDFRATDGSNSSRGDVYARLIE